MHRTYFPFARGFFKHVPPALLGLLVLAGALATAVMDWQMARHARAVRAWPAAVATITAPPVEETEGRMRVHRVSYRYRVEGREFDGSSTMTPGELAAAGLDSLVSAGAPVAGRTLRVRFDPRAPWRSAVGLPREDPFPLRAAFAVMTVVMLAIGGYLAGRPAHWRPEYWQGHTPWEWAAVSLRRLFHPFL